MAELVLVVLTWVASAIVINIVTDAAVYLSVDMVDELQNLEAIILLRFDLVIQAAEKRPHRGKPEAWLLWLREAFYCVLLEAKELYELGTPVKRRSTQVLVIITLCKSCRRQIVIYLEANHLVRTPAAGQWLSQNIFNGGALVSWVHEKLDKTTALPFCCRTHHYVCSSAPAAGCLSRVGGFLVNHIKRVYAIVHIGCTVVKLHCTAADDEMEEQQKRCYEYSKKALAFEGCILAAYFLSPVASSARRTTLFVTMATLFVAMITDVISLKTKPKWGRALVYLSSFLQMLTTFLVFISLDKAYGYAFISVPVLICTSIGIACFQHEQQQLHGDGVDKPAAEPHEDHLDRIFDFSALILNWGALITAILSDSMQAKHSAGITGFLFIFTVILSLYLMMVTTLRDVALATLAIYLDYTLAALLFGTLIATIISFITGKKT